MQPTQRHLPLIEEPRHRLIALPSGSGFFGLSDLQSFGMNIPPLLESGSAETVLFDFSKVRVWDIAALLWLTIALHHFRREGLPFLLQLPGNRLGEKDDPFEKSADFLRRWKFDDALRNICPDPTDLLIPEQRDFFSQPTRSYTEATILSDRGLQEALLSRRLVHIRNLTDPSFLGERVISEGQITKTLAEFQANRLGDILASTCGLPKRDADLFSQHLLSESLQNVKEHPEATIGMVAIAVMGNTNELVLAVADNGRSIPETILSAYESEFGNIGSAGDPSERDIVRLRNSTVPQIGHIAHYATLARKTRKQSSPDHGMGLTYIKEDTLGTFHGKLRIVTENVCLRYEADPMSSEGGGASEENEPSLTEQWQHAWPGNLLRIAIPLANSRKSLA